MAISPLTKFIVKRPWLHRWMMPISQWYMNATGHRKLGLRYEDLLPEENEATQLALKRLPPKEAYDRVFRLRRAFQLSLSHQILPQSEWTRPEEDTRYLSPLIDEIQAELRERDDLNSMVMSKKK